MHPALVPKMSAIAQVSGVTNCVAIDGDFVGALLLVGPGAGAEPDGVGGGRAISSTSRAALVHAAVHLAGRRQLKPRKRAPMPRHHGAYYMRLSVLRPSRRHGRRSPSAWRERERIAGKHRAAAAGRGRWRPIAGRRAVPVVLITHETTEDAYPQGARCNRGRRQGRRAAADDPDRERLYESIGRGRLADVLVPPRRTNAT